MTNKHRLECIILLLLPILACSVSCASGQATGGEDGVAPALADLSCPNGVKDPAYGDLPWHIGRPSRNEAENLHRATLDLDTYPEALCNDGSPGVVYLRAGHDDGRDDWIIHLQGGGGCRDYQSCLERRCSIGVTYDITKMSSLWAPEKTARRGIFQLDTRGRGGENHFADHNVAFIYYCSSDSWIGHKSAVVLEGEGGEKLAAAFEGHGIIAAVIDWLREGARSDNGAVTMPSLDEAERVLFTGVSAGSNGVRGNADWLGEVLRKTNGDVDYRVVADAAFTPRQPDDGDEDSLLAQHAKMVVAFDQRIDAHLDRSCEAAHPDKPGICSDRFHVTHHHVTTPLFLRMDYVDPLPMKKQAEYWGGKRAFAEKIRDAMVDFANLKETAEEADAIDQPPGVFGTTCRQHVYLDVSSFFFGAEIEHEGEWLNYHDLLVRWLDGEPPRVVLDHLAKMKRRMRCPQERPRRR